MLKPDFAIKIVMKFLNAIHVSVSGYFSAFEIVSYVKVKKYF